MLLGSEMSWRLLTSKSWSSRETFHQPAFMGRCPTISQTCLPYRPSRWVSLCVLCPCKARLIVVLLMFFLEWGVWFQYCVIWCYFREWVWNSRTKLCSISPPLLQGSKATVRFHYGSLGVCILCYSFTNTETTVVQWLWARVPNKWIEFVSCVGRV